MNTTSQSLSADQVKDKILNTKGSFVKVSWRSNPTPAAAYKKDGVVLEKHTTGVVRAGINYANLSAVKQGIEDGERGEVQELPWGQWKVDENGKSLFPYIIEHKDEEYIRLYPSEGNNHRCISTFYVNGEPVDKEDFAKYLTPSESKKLLEPTEDDKPLCFTIKAKNILGIPVDVEPTQETIPTASQVAQEVTNIDNWLIEQELKRNDREDSENKKLLEPTNAEKTKALFESSSEVVTKIKMDYNDIDRIINLFFTGNEYPRDGYECVCYEEWSNYESHEISVDGEIDEYDQGYVNAAYSGKFKHYSTQALLNHMAKEGAIPTGDYLINIFW